MNILVVAAHSDDEVLGAGGSIARWVRAGHAVSVLNLTDGVGSRGKNAAAAQRRRKAAQRAAETLGYRLLPAASFPDNQMDTVPLLEIARVIEHTKRVVQPCSVLTHFWGDLNIDHRRTFEAVLTAFRPQPGEQCESILCFEVASATEWGSPAATFRPNHFVELTEADMETAMQAYQCYKEEIRPDPHIRSVEAWRARRLLRGLEVGASWAEGYMVVRQLDRASR